MNNIELLHKYGKDYKRSNFGELYKIIEGLQRAPVNITVGNKKETDLQNQLVEQLLKYKGILKNEPVNGIHERQVIKFLEVMGFREVNAMGLKSAEEIGNYISWVTFTDSKGKQSFGFYIAYNDVPFIPFVPEKIIQREQTGKPYNSKHVFIHPVELKELVVNRKFEVLMYAAIYFIAISKDGRIARINGTDREKSQGLEIAHHILSYKGLTDELPVAIPSQISLNLFIKAALLCLPDKNIKSPTTSGVSHIKIGNRYADHATLFYCATNSQENSDPQKHK